ncbi:hypothetical protein JD969_08550 [Planctomycetota bacterium]|nr:hypothetical protein JD969_08550 [Planctomycetota bacterium]
MPVITENDAEIQSLKLPEIDCSELKPLKKINGTDKTRPYVRISGDIVTIVPTKLPLVFSTFNGIATAAVAVGVYYLTQYLKTLSGTSEFDRFFKWAFGILVIIIVPMSFLLPMLSAIYERVWNRKFIFNRKTKIITIPRNKLEIKRSQVIYVQHIVFPKLKTPIVDDSDDSSVNVPRLNAHEINLVYEEEGERKRVNILRGRRSLRKILGQVSGYFKCPVVEMVQTKPRVTVRRFKAQS